VYEARVHVFIYGNTRSKQFEPEYRCLSSIVDWRVDAVVVLKGFDLWYIEKIELAYEGVIDVDYQWFSSLWNGFCWSTHGKLVCPYYMENNKVFTLTNEGKASFFTATDVSCQRITGT